VFATNEGGTLFSNIVDTLRDGLRD